MDTTNSTSISHEFEETGIIPDLKPAVDETEETSGIMDKTNFELRDAADLNRERDTIMEIHAPHNDNQTPLHRFLSKYKIPRVSTFNSKGVSCADGRKMDVLIKDRGMIVFQYDVPMVIGGKLRGYSRYDLIFSEFTGDCITCDFKDDFHFDTATEEGRLLKLEYCTRQRPDWREIMTEFDTEFEKANLY